MPSEVSSRYTTVFGETGNCSEKCNVMVWYVKLMKAKFKCTKSFININFKPKYNFTFAISFYNICTSTLAVKETYFCQSASRAIRLQIRQSSLKNIGKNNFNQLSLPINANMKGSALILKILVRQRKKERL